MIEPANYHDQALVQEIAMISLSVARGRRKKGGERQCWFEAI